MTTIWQSATVPAVTLDAGGTTLVPVENLRAAGNHMQPESSISVYGGATMKTYNMLP